MKKLPGFISDSERFEILSFVNSLNIKLDITNEHISKVASELKGSSYMFDITKTKLSNELSTFQSSDNLINIDLPPIFYSILNRISNQLQISKSDVFLQILNQQSSGIIHPHYDSAIEGFITYKCNVAVQSENYQLNVGDDVLDIKESDLYCFEASLFKHWTKPFTQKRVILSYGFILPYKDLCRDENDVRVRLSKRIIKYFQNSAEDTGNDPV